jgi:hypothetical protein
MSNPVKKIKAVYRNDAKYYRIIVSGDRYYARRITEFAWWFGDDQYKDLGNSRGIEDAMMLVKLDAATFGDVVRYEIDD